LHKSSIQDISRLTGKSEVEIKVIADLQIQNCENNELISLLNWSDNYKSAPERILWDRAAVIIPTVWWGTQPHNIVLVNYMDPGEELSWTIGPQGWKDVYYHDPNEDDNLPTMTEDEFFKKWLHPNTDNDLLIISKNRVNSNLLTGNYPGAAAHAAAHAAANAAAFAAATLAATYSLPIVSVGKKILWDNIFQCYPIPQFENTKSKEDFKMWALAILERINEHISIPLTSKPDIEDEAILENLITKYEVELNMTLTELKLLEKIKKVNNKLDNEIFFLLYRLIE